MKDANRVRLRERFTRIEFVVVIFVAVITAIIVGTAIPRALFVNKSQTPSHELGISEQGAN